jgi:tripartite-type tricarboxylate transporter receptor subunit TctC
MVPIRVRSKPVAYVAAALVALLTASCAGADSDTNAEDPAEAGESVDLDAAAEFYEGETLTLVVPFSPGGGYDSYARMLAPYIEEEIGANVVVENLEGAGGLLAINQLLTDRSEGLRVAIMNAVGVGGAAIAEAEGPAFELDELAYIARIGQEPHLVVVGAQTPYETFEDIASAPDFRFGSTGPGAADFVNSNVLVEVFALDAEIITGFEGSSENELAVTRGDVDGMTGDFDSRIGAVEDGDHRPILLIGEDRRDEVPDTPAVLELDLTDEQRAVVEAHLALLAMGRPIVASPTIPADHLEFLRQAFDRVMNNSDLIAEADTQGRPLNYLPGHEMDDLVQDLLDAPDAYRQTLAIAYAS